MTGMKIMRSDQVIITEPLLCNSYCILSILLIPYNHPLDADAPLDNVSMRYVLLNILSK